MAGLIPRPIRKLFIWLVIAVGLGLAGSVAWARLKLNAVLAEAGPGFRASSFGIVSSSSTPVKTAGPFTVRAGQVIGEIEKLFKGVQGPAPAQPK